MQRYYFNYRRNSQFVIIVVCCLLLIGVGTAQEQNEIDEHNDLAITYRQKMTLDKFKDRVAPSLPFAYMKEDLYLIRWLRASDFNLKTAEENLKTNIQWRKANRMDTIHSEDFSDVAPEYPVYIDTYDKKGQPAITANAGSWDFRQGIVAGRDKRIVRYMLKTLDEATNLVREGNQNGKNITRFDYLLNLDGFNVVQHGCPRCMLLIFDILKSYDQYYPGMIDRMIIINAPPTIRVLFGPLVRSAVSGSTLGSVNLKIIGTNQAEWKKFLLKYFAESQLPEDFGGSKVRLE